MAELSLQDAYLADKVVDPNSAEFAALLSILMSDPTDDRSPAQKLRSKGEFKYTFPYRGEPQDEAEVREVVPLKFAERGTYRNGIASLAISTAEILDLTSQYFNKKRRVPALVASAEIEAVQVAVDSAGGIPAMVKFVGPEDLLFEALSVQPDTLLFDHTTINAPVDEVLNMAYRGGIHIVDGVFPYHVSAMRGWDCVTGIAKWSYTHDKNYLTIGPNDDASRLLKYKIGDYKKFLDPKRWTGNARKYGYELRQWRNGLVSYRAVYLGEVIGPLPENDLMYDLPLCSSDENVLISINRELAAGVFVSKSNNAQELARLERDYAIEVRKDLFESCVNFLVAKTQNSDIVGDAIRYITQHNYVDLVDGVRVVRCASLAYADALCVAIVCALTAFNLRYRLTSESVPDVYRHKTDAAVRAGAPLGALGKLAYYMATYVKDAANRAFARSAEAALRLLYGSDKIPGVCYDVYCTTRYSPDLDWYEHAAFSLQEPVGELRLPDDNGQGDAISNFIGQAQKTSTATAVREIVPSIKAIKPIQHERYRHKPDPDPIATLQHVYDQILPGNSVAQLQNAAELKRVRDVDLHTEFYGKIEINKDVAANELLHQDASVRTASLPITRTSLLDAITASAKRNFNPPDMQTQSDPWAYAKYLVDRFVLFAFGREFDMTIGESYRKEPITFNVQDYIEWNAGKNKAYRSALEAECPEDIVALELEKYDTIIKKRVKPKLSTSAQYEMAQPQVVVSLDKKDTALFTHVFRKMFERFDAALRPEFKSAGRMSDDDITNWLTDNKDMLLALECLEVDSSKYDKSQGLLARMIEALLLEKLGLDPGVNKIFEDSYVGRVSSKTLGLMFISAYQMKSGAPQTMLGNIIYNMVSVMECVGPRNVKAMLAKGDDNLVWVATGFDQKTTIADKMSRLFNLECKLVTGQVWYFSSGYVVPVNGKLHFVPDVVKMWELLGERGHDPRTMAERFISFQDRVRSLTADQELPGVYQDLVRYRMHSPDANVVVAIDALATLASDVTKYMKAVQG